MMRASHYDFCFRILISKFTNFKQGVKLEDITCTGDLEQRAFAVTSESIAREISRIVDYMSTSSQELKTLDCSAGREKYTGPCAFLKAQGSVEFFNERGFMETAGDPDGLYGWSHVLSNPGLKASSLACKHGQMTSHADSVAKIASTIVMLYQIDS